MRQPFKIRAVLSVQARILFLLFLQTLILLTYVGWSNRNERLQLETFLQSQENQFATHFNQVFNLFQKPLDIVSYEYSLWDEMVDFVEKRDEKWAKDNIDFLLRQYGIAGAWVFDPDRSLVYVAHSKEAERGDINFSEAMGKALFSSDHACHFFLPASRGLLEVFGRKIQPSSDNKRVSPEKGYLFIARLWTDKVASELGRLSEGQAALEERNGTLPGASYTKRESDAFILSLPLKGWEGKPVAFLSVAKKTPLRLQMKVYSDREIKLSITFGCLSVALLAGCLWICISRPLKAISKSLTEKDLQTISKLSKSQTEFGQISRLIARSFREEQDLVEEVERRKKAESDLKIAGEELEQRVAERTDALSRSTQLLRSLASQLLLAEERERRLIADDLHDHIGQILVLAKLRVQQLKETSQDHQSVSSLQEIQNLLADTLSYTRSLTTQLSPPILREFGFEAAVISLASEFEREYRIPVIIEDDRTACIGDNQIAFLLYRSVRELLHNIAKHSGATRVKILFATRHEQILIVVEDDGFGFIPDQVNGINEGTGFGLFSIKERLAYLGGEMKIESAPGRGTKVSLFVPAISTINGEDKERIR